MNERIMPQSAETVRSTVYHPFGRLIVNKDYAPFDIEDKDIGLSLKEGDQILAIHLPPVYKNEDSPLSKITSSLQMLANNLYISKEYPNARDIIEDLNPANFNAIVGITYEKLAHISQRAGFRIADAENIDTYTRNEIEKIYSRYVGKTGRPIGRIMICYQALDDFLERYASDKIMATNQARKMCEILDSVERVWEHPVKAREIG